MSGVENIRAVPGQEVRRELFDCISREVRDELNIPRDKQQPPELLGTVINHERAGRLCKYELFLATFEDENYTTQLHEYIYFF